MTKGSGCEIVISNVFQSLPSFKVAKVYPLLTAEVEKVYPYSLLK